MSSWKKRQIAWQQERLNHFGQHEAIIAGDSGSESGSESEISSVRSTVNNNYRHIMDQPHQDTISVLRVGVYNQKFYFHGYPSGSVILIRGQSYIIDLSHPSNRGHQLVISRSTTHGAVNGMVSIGEPGNPGAFIALFIGSGRPRSLYYYCTIYRGMSGDISIVDSNDM
jgi:hypothetical protein